MFEITFRPLLRFFPLIFVSFILSTTYCCFCWWSNFLSILRLPILYCYHLIGKNCAFSSTVAKNLDDIANICWILLYEHTVQWAKIQNKLQFREAALFASNVKIDVFEKKIDFFSKLFKKNFIFNFLGKINVSLYNNRF